MIVCYVILVNRPFETEIAGKKIFFQKNDVLLTDNISQSFFLRHPGNVTELRIDECIVRKYMESADRIQHSDSAVSVPFIKTTFSHIALLHNVMQNLSLWICPYISRHLLSLNPLLACCRRYSRG
ncbi:hypothetical protein, partial [Escherichia coli]|uniref:hypothetical protein n=1 Tax=Escherichia coli TaxID=562 RepID=UPI00207C246B